MGFMPILLSLRDHQVQLGLRSPSARSWFSKDNSGAEGERVGSIPPVLSDTGGKQQSGETHLGSTTEKLEMANAWRIVSDRSLVFTEKWFSKHLVEKYVWKHNLYTIYTQSFLLLLDSILGFGPENLNGTWAQQKEKQCATERMWDGTFGLFWHRISKWQRGATRETMGHWKHVKRGSWVFETENLNGTWGQQGQKMGHWKHGLLGFRLRKSNGTRAQQGKQIGFESRHVRWDFGSFGFLNQKIYINGTGVQQGQKMGQWKHVRERDIYIYNYMYTYVYVTNIAQYV